MTSNDGGYYPPPGGQPWGGQQGPSPGYPVFPPQPSAKRKGPWPWIIGIGAVLVVIIVVAAIGLIAFGSGGDDDAQTQQRTVVTYEVTGAVDSVELIYYSDKGQEHLATAALPWRETVTLEGEDAYFDVSAQTVDASDQELTCRVTADGRTLIEDRTVSGFVGCGGRLNEF
ncbi:MmpS family transport accessory protein [Mycobacterium sp. NPDC003323]